MYGRLRAGAARVPGIVAGGADTASQIGIKRLLEGSQRPRLIKAHHSGGTPAHRLLTARFMKTAISATALFGAAVGCVFYIALPFLKQPASIADYVPAFWLIMAGLAMRNVADFGAMALFSSHRDRMMTLTNLAAVVALTLAQLLLLPFAGLYGAGAAILLTFSAVTLWRYKLLFGRSVGMRPADVCGC